MDHIIKRPQKHNRLLISGIQTWGKTAAIIGKASSDHLNDIMACSSRYSFEHLLLFFDKSS
eukprot:3975726-Prorocentrum_lima.AAC.1